MNNSIRTYEDLLQHKKELKELMFLQKELIYLDIKEIKDDLKPVTDIASSAARFFTPKNNQPVLVSAASGAIGFLFKNVILARAGWVGRTIIPFLAKKVSSGLLNRAKKGLLAKFGS